MDSPYFSRLLHSISPPPAIAMSLSGNSNTKEQQQQHFAIVARSSVGEVAGVWSTRRGSGIATTTATTTAATSVATTTAATTSAAATSAAATAARNTTLDPHWCPRVRR